MHLLDKNKINEILGYCYEELNYFDIAEYYYYKSLSYDSTNIEVLSKLLFIYKKLSKNDQIINICNKLLNIDPQNKLAKKYLLNNESL